MAIEILLNRDAPGAAEIGAELAKELRALEITGVEITSKTAPAPEGALVLHEVYQFVIQHHHAIVNLAPLAAAALQTVNTILKRHGITPKQVVEVRVAGDADAKSGKHTSSPFALFVVDGKSIQLPSEGAKSRKFLGALAKAKGTDSSRPAPKKSKAKSKVRRKR